MKTRTSIPFGALSGSAGVVTARSTRFGTILSGRAHQPGKVTPQQKDKRALFARVGRCFGRLNPMQVEAWAAVLLSVSRWYRPGETAHLVAEPSNGWEFDHWEDQPDNHNPERDVVMNSDVNLTAVFVAIRSTYDLYWNPNVYSFGSIESDVDCGTFDRGEEVVITAVPANENYEFVRWSDGNTANPRTLVANRDYDIIAEFRHKTETKQISVDSYYGETTGSGTYHLGELVEISVTPNEGFHMVHWDDDDNETDLVRRFYITRYTPRYFEAILESDATYHIRAVCEPEEAGTVTGCVEAAHYEDSVELDVTPAPGWRIVEWSDDRHFDGDHRSIDVYEDLDLVVYLEEIEPDED